MYSSNCQFSCAVWFVQSAVCLHSHHFGCLCLFSCDLTRQQDDVSGLRGGVQSLCAMYNLRSQLCNCTFNLRTSLCLFLQITQSNGTGLKLSIHMLKLVCSDHFFLSDCQLKPCVYMTPQIVYYYSATLSGKFVKLQKEEQKLNMYLYMTALLQFDQLYTLS